MSLHPTDRFSQSACLAARVLAWQYSGCWRTVGGEASTGRARCDSDEHDPPRKALRASQGRRAHCDPHLEGMAPPGRREVERRTPRPPEPELHQTRLQGWASAIQSCDRETVGEAL